MVVLSDNGGHTNGVVMSDTIANVINVHEEETAWAGVVRAVCHVGGGSVAPVALSRVATHRTCAAKRTDSFPLIVCFPFRSPARDTAGSNYNQNMLYLLSGQLFHSPAAGS